MRREPFRKKALILGLTLIVVSTPLLGQRSDKRKKEKAISSIDTISFEIADLSEKDIRENLSPEKLDTPKEDDKDSGKGKKQAIELTGKIKASKGLKIESVRHWNEDASPYAVEFQGKGTISLELPKKLESEDRKKVKTRKDVYWVTVAVKPALSSESDEPSYLFIDGATIAFAAKPAGPGQRMGNAFALNGDAVDAEMDDWFRLGITFPLDRDGQANFPLGFTLRIDPEAEEWDLFMMNRLRYAGIAYGKPVKDITYRSAGNGTTILSELSVSAENPLFEDADADGIEDAEEIELGFSAEENDRYALDELGEYTNLQYFTNLRKVYPSRAARELEQTLLEAAAAAELGETPESLEKRKIPEDKRGKSFTEEEFRRQSDEAKAKLRNFGRKPEDRSEDPSVLLTEDEEGVQP